MRQRKTFLLLGLVVTILTLGIVYAAIANVTLNVAGNVTASPDQGNFKIAYNKKNSYTGDGSATFGYYSDTHIYVNVSGLKTVGDSLTAIIGVENYSVDIPATVSASAELADPGNQDGIDIDDTEYFSISTSLDSTTLAAGATTNLRITVKLIKTPVDGEVVAWIWGSLIASPSIS